MGLASKLAAANPGGQGMPPGGGPPYPTGGSQQYPQQYPPQSVPPPPGGRPISGGGAYPGQQQYQAYNPQGQPAQQQQGYGAPPPGAGGYGQQPPMQQGGINSAQFRNKIQQAIQQNGLGSFYQPGSPQVEQLAQKASQHIPALAQRWRIPMEIAVDLCQIGLYDVVIFIDDSGSMAFEENGERIKDLQLILERVASVATIFDDDGVSIRFMNANYQQHLIDNIKTEGQIHQLMSSVNYKGLTPMGTELRKKVLDGVIFPKMRQGQMQKPFLVIVITDGQPAGEPAQTVGDTLRTAMNEVRSNFPPNTQAITFQFAQVGNDLAARNFLAKLDEDPQFGNIVDCTSNFENESDEMRKMGQDLTPEMWLVKLMLGAIDRSYDSKDESNPPPIMSGGQGGPGGYPGQGQYGGGPPQGGYRPPPGPPPQQGGYQGYGQQQQQGGYGGGGGYHPQQGQGGPRY